MHILYAQAVIFFTDVNRRPEYKELEDILDIVSKTKCDFLRYLITAKEQLGWENTVEEIQSFADQNKLALCRLPIFDLNSIKSIFNKVSNDLLIKYPLGINNDFYYDDQIDKNDSQKQKTNECLIS